MLWRVASSWQLQQSPDQPLDGRNIGCGQFYVQRHRPVPLVGEVAAFYGIFLRHQHRRVVGEADVSLVRGRVIGQRPCVEVESLGAQRIEEGFGIADAGKGVHSPAPE